MGGCFSASTSPDSPGRLKPGHQLQHGKLRVVRALGQGSWANVYLVEREQGGQHYALKRTLITDLSQAEKWIVVNEVRLLASLSHPNVVVFKSSFVEDGCLNVIMEVVAHGDLSAVIEQHRKDGRRISEDTVWGYLLQVVLGLQHLHDSGIIHRDVKPANILIGRDGVLKIADLGVAGLLHMGSSKLQIGTLQYMAPEMHAGLDYSYAADVWSLGCLVYELCQLEPLFGDREEEVVARKVRGLLLPPAIPAKYSPELQIMVNRMLQQDPKARPSLGAILASPQMQSRMEQLPAELSTELSLRTMSLDCMEGVPILPAIDVPADLSQLNSRLPAPRGSFEHMHEAAEMAERLGLPAIPLPKPAQCSCNDGGAASAAAEDKAAGGLQVSSPVTVMEGCDSGTASSTMSVIDAAVAAALAAEKAAAYQI